MAGPTKRELQVLQLICDGCTTKETALRLGISFKTAASHRAKLFEKAGVHSSIALFRWALTNRLVSFEPGVDS
jgi:two-component system response regulator NreC